MLGEFGTHLIRDKYLCYFSQDDRATSHTSQRALSRFRISVKTLQ